MCSCLCGGFSVVPMNIEDLKISNNRRDQRRSLALHDEQAVGFYRGQLVSGCGPNLCFPLLSSLCFSPELADGVGSTCKTLWVCWALSVSHECGVAQTANTKVSEMGRTMEVYCSRTVLSDSCCASIQTTSHVDCTGRHIPALLDFSQDREHSRAIFHAIVFTQVE